ncbi:type III-B CRISPR module RAMP protein Cmr6 [Aliarcobacter butzleri]|uniref:type III-B CRISPR module RAMP protein Cmr6 n=1 Tax=Aliarcobacter butzleri TaxID=28197 RepID=UPI00263F4BFE|nr:type III-B CRISPR module RAMP protein Cmr6 [Aliarcobacter butzleri]MDN5077920.1 type III-B CRISPR module RAMP protein Cmr6 [Aliarcobacter butzleri]MDN5119248.1 type III-B CRISPR module RAMP protein Cmr6 [Aliarcobacter butzleri]
MAFFTLFKVSKDENYNNLKKELSELGKINFFKLNPDKDDKDLQFGQLDFSECDSNKVHEYFSKKNIKIKEQQSRNQQSQARKSNEKKEFKQEKTNNSSDIHNPSFHFYKDTNYGKEIENFTFKNSCSYFEIPNTQTFKLTTIYPGLLVGSGYNHPKLKDNKDDFQLGFFFDHTTGLPIISGSSIKGLLRSVCEKNDFMQDVYKKQIPLEIFEDGKTIFYDAYIVSTNNENKGKIFGSDYITNHYSNEENGMFKEPNPIKFLKILSGVTFKFQFKCDEKYLELFKQIILDFGLGAKTNVGYGKFK